MTVLKGFLIAMSLLCSQLTIASEFGPASLRVRALMDSEQDVIEAVMLSIEVKDKVTCFRDDDKWGALTGEFNELWGVVRCEAVTPDAKGQVIARFIFKGKIGEERLTSIQITR